MDLTIALHKCRPGAQWSNFNDDYNLLVWNDKIQTKPTFQELQQAYIEALQEINARKVWTSRVEFWNEFSMQEKIDIAASTNSMVRFFFAELTIWNGEVWSDDPRVQSGLDLLVSETVITNQRKQEILAK